MPTKEEIYQHYLAAKGDCQKYKDTIDYYTYLQEDEHIENLSTDAINQIKNAINSLQELINTQQELSIDKKYLEMAIEKGKKLLEKFM